MCFFANLLAPWQETFADAWDGDGGRGTIWDHFLNEHNETYF